MGIGGSVHTVGGWKNQLARVKRWHYRVQEIGLGKPRVVGPDQGERDHDDLYSFFQNCYHLRDWLIHSANVPTQELDAFVQANIEMQICRDVCNGTKHLVIHRPSVDANFSMGREYVPKNWPSRRPNKWYIIAGSTKLDLFDMADRCMELWTEFLQQRGLL